MNSYHNGKQAPSILCVGNFDSNTGYAWKLIEHLWVILRDVFEEKGFDVIACYPSLSVINRELIENEIRIFEHDFNMRTLTGVIATVKFLARHRVEILYLTDRPAISLSYFVFRIFRVRRIIVHDHMPGYRPAVTGVKKFLKRFVGRVSLVSADTVIGVSPYVCARLAEVTCMPENRIRLVMNGISDTRYLKEHDLIQPATVKLVTVARVNRYKGIDFAIETFAHLVHEMNCKNLQYDIVGDGPDLDEFKRMARSMGVETYINFLGRQERVAELLPNYDFAFHPSRGEAMCLAIVEYMRCGLATVCSTNRSVNSILQQDKDALFYDEDSTEAAAYALKEMINSVELRERLGVNARLSFEVNYGQASMERHFRRVLEDK